MESLRDDSVVFSAKFMWSQQPGAAKVLPEMQLSVNRPGQRSLRGSAQVVGGAGVVGGSLSQGSREQRELSSHCGIQGYL